MKARARTRAAAWSGLAAILFLHVLLLGDYNKRDQRPPTWDPAVHLQMALDIKEGLAAGRPLEFLRAHPKPGHPPYPPFVYLAALPLLDGPRPERRVLWLNLIFMALIGAGLVGLGASLGRPVTGLGAAAFILLNPYTVDNERLFLVDFALGGWVAAAYACQFLSKDYRSRLWSWALGLSVGLGFFTKFTYWTYVLPLTVPLIQALRHHGTRRRHAAEALAAAAAVGAPWYLFSLPALLVRVVPDALLPPSGHAATASLGAKFGFFAWDLGWHMGIVATAGVIGGCLLAVRRKRKVPWLLLAWPLAAYLFWSLVPNKNIRYLFPGWLGACFLAAWLLPKPATGLLAAWGLVSTLHMQVGKESTTASWLGHNVSLLRADPPNPGDWHLEDMLRTADRLLDEGPPAELTFVADHPYLNGPNLGWVRRRLGLANLTPRGTRRRLCEFSRFVLFKDENSAQADPTGNLASAAREIAKPDGWFRAAYAEKASWPLPDGSTARLFEQRTLPRAPFKAKALAWPGLEDDRLRASKVRIALGRWDALRGSYPKVEVEAESVSLDGLAVRGLKAEADDVFMVPRSSAPGDVRLLRIGTVRLKSAELKAEDLERWLERKAKGLAVTSLALGPRLSLSGRFKGLPVRAELDLGVSPASGPGRPAELWVSVLEARVAGLPLPGLPRTFSRPIVPGPEMPFRLELPELVFRDGALRAGG